MFSTHVFIVAFQQNKEIYMSKNRKWFKNYVNTRCYL